jgi:hypothetical protein
LVKHFARDVEHRRHAGKQDLRGIFDYIFRLEHE